MLNRRGYLILSMLFIVNSICYWWYGERILTFLYGYDKHLIEAVSPESFKANQQLAIGKLIYFLITTLLSLATLIASVYMHKRTERVYKFIVEAVCILAFIFTTICIIAFVVGTPLKGSMV